MKKRKEHPRKNSDFVKKLSDQQNDESSIYVFSLGPTQGQANILSSRFLIV